MTRTASIALAAASILALSTAPARAADAARGHTLYSTVGCSLCHGTVGQGSSSAPRLAPDPPAFEAARDFVRGPPTDRPSYARMPAYSEKILPDADLQDILAFLRTIPPSKTVAQIPLLNR